MRDHPLHVVPFVGCIWSTKLLKENIRSQWIKSWKSGLEDNVMWQAHYKWGPDQEFLDK